MYKHHNSINTKNSKNFFNYFSIKHTQLHHINVSGRNLTIFKHNIIVVLNERKVKCYYGNV